MNGGLIIGILSLVLLKLPPVVWSGDIDLTWFIGIILNYDQVTNQRKYSNGMGSGYVKWFGWLFFTQKWTI